MRVPRSSLAAAAAAMAVAVAAALVSPAALGGEPAEIEQRLAENVRKAFEELQAKDYDGAIRTYRAVLEDVEKLDADETTKANIRQLAHYNTACAYALKGEKQAALDSFERALAAGFDDFEHIARDSDLDAIRGEPRFRELVTKHEARAKETRAAAARREAEALVEKISKEALFPFDFEVTALDGKTLRLADLRGKVVLVDFWGTWCPPCRAAIPHLVELRKELAARGFEVVGLNWERGALNSAEIVKKFAAEHEIPYPLAVVGDDLLSKAGVEAFPTMLLVDRAGRVRLKKVGYTEGAVLRAAIENLLGEPPPAGARGEGGGEPDRRVF